MQFIETPTFTRLIVKLVDDDGYKGLQTVLMRYPQAGDLIPGGNGLRKMRWASPGRRKGKRGGIRVIYSIISAERLLMHFAYDKDKQEDLTGEQLKMMRSTIKGEAL